jgi:hypothetical protein
MGPEKDLMVRVKTIMASSAVEGGLNSLHKLGSTDVNGVSRRTGSRSWSVADNGNPDDMVTFVRNFMGQDDDVLFIVERDFNRNVVIYRPCFVHDGTELNTSKVAGGSWLIVPDDVDLDNMTEEVVDDLVEEDLTKLEHLGYGVKKMSGGEGELKFSIAALPDTPLTLFKHVDEEGSEVWRVSIEIEEHRWIVRRIMLHTKPRALGLFPSVTEVHLEVEDYGAHGMVAQFYYST